MNQLLPEVENFVALRSALKLEFADIDDQTLSDTLEGLSDVRAVIAKLTRSAIEDETLAGALRRRIDEMRERLARFEARRERKREIVLLSLERTGINKLVEPDFTVHVRMGAPALTVVEEEAIPPDFWVMREPELNRGAVLKALKSGAMVPGALIEPGHPVLAIRKA